MKGLENKVGKGENAGIPAFSPFPIMFSKAFFFTIVETWDCEVNVYKDKIDTD